MPSVRKAGGSAFRKDVEFVTKEDGDSDEQVAAGIVMVPDKVDLQNDFVREDTLRAFADQFATFYEAGEAGGGVMHAVFPDEWMHLERNEVLDEAEEIGGEEVAAGAWVQEWAIDDDGLWGLIVDDIISGYSIGAVSVDWSGPFEQDELDDVAVPDELGDDMIYELIDGIIREVSAVDIPAVPDAQILDVKTAGSSVKRLGDYLGNPDGFIEEALARGHSEEDAERLWEQLNRAIEVEGSAEPGTKSRITEAAKNLIDAVTGSGEAEQSASRSDETPADVDDGSDAPTDKDAPGGDTPDDNGGSSTDAADDTTMTDDINDDGGDGDKSLAEQNAEQISDLTAAVTDLTETIAGPTPKTAEIEIDGETYELPESKVKAALGVDEEAGVDLAAAIESLKSEVDDVSGRLDNISRQSGVGSNQVEATSSGEEGDEESGLGGLGKALS